MPISRATEPISRSRGVEELGSKRFFELFQKNVLSFWQEIYVRWKSVGALESGCD